MNDYTEKISKLFNDCDLSLKNDEKIQIRCFRIPPMEHYLLWKPKPMETRVREIKALSLLSSTNTPLLQKALETDRCVGAQELHLFDVRKNFTEKFHKFHNVIKLKMPNVTLSKERLRIFVDQVLKDNYKIEMISKSDKTRLVNDNELFKYNYF